MKNASLTIRLNEMDKARLELLAQQKEIPVAQLVREAIKQYLNKGE